MPVTLAEAVNQVPFEGFFIPEDSVPMYEILIQGSYRLEKTGIAFKTQREAEISIMGAFALEETGYGDNRNRVFSKDSLQVAVTYITLQKQRNFVKTLDSLKDQDKIDKYEAVLTECWEDLNKLRDEESTKTFYLARKQEYLDLANGDKKVAKKFWEKTETVSWPED